MHSEEKKRHCITVKYVNDPPKWADDDRTDWTMKTISEDLMYVTALS